jgi:ATP/maltotriose-dependent transcriptional regulator MalT
MLSSLPAVRLHRRRPTSSLVAPHPLTQRLDEALQRGHRLILILAHAGHGKATLNLPSD